MKRFQLQDNDEEGAMVAKHTNKSVNYWQLYLNFLN